MSKSTRSSQRLSNVDNAASKAFSRTAKNKRIDPNNEFNDYPDLFSHFNDLMHQHIKSEIEFTVITAELNKHVSWELPTHWQKIFLNQAQLASAK